MVALENAQTFVFDNRPITVIRPTSEDPQAPPLVALHGWTGNEHSMDIFIRRMPSNRWILVPRAPYPAEPDGYAWVPPTPERPAPWETFAQSAMRLKEEMDNWLAHFSLPTVPVDLMGFSQGAAMALTYAILFPERVNRLIVLSGFLPRGGTKALRPGSLSGKAWFLAHGYHDEIVPIERAWECIEGLKLTGATVNSCLDNVGHRVSAKCLHAMLEFLSPQ
ncbi:alpha/beta fold hydrolase [uncultured Thermanaerothrix sp.]|uniref:alpha/beta hydrolase n=1 Tax=uncultured Thermanaerothrix sp. TaxID=1195149 RepID=UPI002602F074|nr:alpha/beta fold hydrolase [uncultured Thermanaerothrix sp.]